jgi:hypothetical protein
MLPFLWILMSMGVGYAAKICGRAPFLWFMLAMLASPLIGSLALWAAKRYRIGG